jgi:phosphoribosylformylglycinamidine synthase
VIEEPVARILEGDAIVAEAPVALLTEAPQYRRQGQADPQVRALQQVDLDALPDAPPAGLTWNETLLALLGAPNVAARRNVYRRYDHQVLTNTVAGPGGDAAVLRIKGTDKAIALAADGNGRLCYLDPEMGGTIVVAEAARNVVCAGGEPAALTDCLNFGNPERPEVYFQLEQCISGMSRACRALGVPVISGNVSLYNETAGRAIYPTPIVGMLGVLANVEQRCGPGFCAAGDVVLLLGQELGTPGTADAQGLAGSEYLAELHGRVAGRPVIDLDLEVRVQRLCLDGIRSGLVRSAHDCSDGGLAVALAESCLAGGVGLAGSPVKGEGRRDSMLFGEQQSRIVVSAAAGRVDELTAAAAAAGVPVTRLGLVGGDRLQFGPLDLPLDRLRDAWEGGLDRSLGRVAAGG